MQGNARKHFVYHCGFCTTVKDPDLLYMQSSLKHMGMARAHAAPRPLLFLECGE